MTTYRYFLEPIGPEANEALADLLNQMGESASSCERRNVMTQRGLVEFMYEVPRHATVTIAGHSVHKGHFRAYVQEGAGKIRQHSLYKNIGKRVSRAKGVQRVKRELKEKAKRR